MRIYLYKKVEIKKEELLKNLTKRKRKNSKLNL